jgi:hypothetical protein
MVTIHSPGFLPRASSAIRSWMSRIERTRPSDGKTLRRPSRSMWAWPSVMPGMTALPLRSTTRVAGPVWGAIASFGPTATILSLEIAMACVTVDTGSIVMILPSRRTISAAGAAGVPGRRAPSPCTGPATAATAAAAPAPERKCRRRIDRLAMLHSLTLLFRFRR